MDRGNSFLEPRRSVDIQRRNNDSGDNFAAGVTGFLQTELGRDTRNLWSPHLTVLKYKIEIQKYLQAKVTEHSSFRYALN